MWGLHCWDCAEKGTQALPLLLRLGSVGKGIAGAIPGLCLQDCAILGGGAPLSHTTGLQVEHVAPLPWPWSGI